MSTRPHDQTPQKSLGHFVRVRGAREHNLKNVDVDIPRDAVVVFTGISGSGKSSLAFGTLFAESQRRYLESVSPYARRLIDQVGAPAFTSIEGLPPAVALQQQRGATSTRSSVGSVSTLSSLLRLLYSRAGTYPRGQAMLFAEDFSANTPQGACPECHGLGHAFSVTEQTLVPDDSLTIRQRAIAAWPQAWGGQNLRDILVSMDHDVDIPWKKLPRKLRDWILFTDEQPTVPVYAGLTPAQTRAARRRGDSPSYMGTFSSARRHVLTTYATTESALMKRRVAAFMISTPCPICHGKRLTQAALSVRFAGYDIGELAQVPLTRLIEILGPAAAGEFTDEKTPVKRVVKNHPSASARPGHHGALDVLRTPDLSQEKRIAAQRLAHEVRERALALVNLGLGYLTLERSTPTLSPGELQRLRLATQIHSQLFGVVYVLDEPTAGLHPADAETLFAALLQLKSAGNSLFVVEHDLHIMRQADWLIEVGPDAGERGGRILYSGLPMGLQGTVSSHTARYLFAEPVPPSALRREPSSWLGLRGVTCNNLKDLIADIPLGILVAVTGVSGSGKSSLISQALVELVGRHLGAEPTSADDDEEERVAQTTAGYLVAGTAEAIARLVVVDQKPIGRTPRSNLATYTGLFDQVRHLFAATPAARARRWSAGRFSFNVAAGRCATCAGEGVVSIELLFMPSAYAPCPICRGSRYAEATLEVLWQGRSIAQILELTVEEACAVFAEEAAVLRPLQILHDIGLGYLRLGQPATELSGGEAQRIKLATELQRRESGRTMYILDEPTTGLHPADVDRLLAQLDHLVENGNSVIMVEHDMRVVARSDWVIDLGPGAGDDGGHILVSGPPEVVSRTAGSRTASYLAAALGG